MLKFYFLLVLSDPHKRAIYDSLGTKGLETEGWEIVQRTKTPAEIRAEYEQLAEERAERRKKQATNPTGNITIAINATDLFNPYQNYIYDEEFEEYIKHFFYFMKLNCYIKMHAKY